jgi:hypothetical protein
MEGKMTGRQLLKSKIDALMDEEVEEVLEYICVMESVKEHMTSPDPLDELIAELLSEAMKRSLPGGRASSARAN